MECYYRFIWWLNFVFVAGLIGGLAYVVAISVVPDNWPNILAYIVSAAAGIIVGVLFGIPLAYKAVDTSRRKGTVQTWRRDGSVRQRGGELITRRRDAMRDRFGVLSGVRSMPVGQYTIAALHAELHTAYHQTKVNFATNTAIRIEQKEGQDHLILTPLDRLEEPKSLLTLRRRVTQHLPPIDLPEVILEMHAQTNFGSAFTHASDGNARAENLPLSICAVLIAEACNIGLTPVVNPNNPALTYDRLTWVQQNYIRSETISRANAMLVDAHAKLTLAQAWGGSEVASADGLRFVVPVRTINAGYNSKYFGVGKGVSYYNFTSNQFSGFNAIVIPGTVRDSLLSILRQSIR